MKQRARQAGDAVHGFSRRFVRELVYAKEYFVLAALFIAVVAGLSLVTYTGVETLRAVRVYTHAEALYALAQKDAVYFLHQYAVTGKAEYFEKYEDAIAVPLGYRQVRAELEKADPNPALVREGMLQGRSHPDDARMGPVWLFRLLRRLGPGARALRLWSEADLRVTELQDVAGFLRAEVSAPQPDPAHIAELLREIERLHLNLSTFEAQFSATLVEAARQVRRFVLASVGLAALLLLSLGLVSAARILRRLKSSEEQFRRLFEQSRDAIVFVGIDGSVDYANPAAFALFGYPPDGFEDTKPTTRALEDYFADERELQRLRHALATDGFVQDAEVQLRRHDGHVLDCLVTASLIRDRAGRAAGVETILHDISARKRTERRMRLLERAVEASGNVILISDATRPDYPLVYVNPAFERITGFAAEEALGRTGFFLLSADDDASARTLDVLERALLDEAESRVVLRTHRRDGTPMWNELSLSPVYDADGQLINYVGVQTDVTEIKEAEETLKKALAREKELSELQARFVSMASHEFRTPLATILSSAELVERFRDRWDEARTLKHLRRIQDSVKSLTALLENVLMINRVEAGRVAFKPTTLDLVVFSRELLDEIWLGHGNAHRLEVTLPPPPLPARADADLLRSVLGNLLTNAIKYSPAGSVVRFALEQEGRRAVFRIEDEGIGIPEADLQNVVDPFHRGANVEAIPGTGLGLSIALRAVELHGGTLTLESEEGGGTLATVVLPLVAQPTPAAANA